MGRRETGEEMMWNVTWLIFYVAFFLVALTISGYLSGIADSMSSISGDMRKMRELDEREERSKYE
jgi:hypothetical protein